MGACGSKVTPENSIVGHETAARVHDVVSMLLVKVLKYDMLSGYSILFMIVFQNFLCIAMCSNQTKFALRWQIFFLQFVHFFHRWHLFRENLNKLASDT